MNNFDTVIIGGGPGGYVAALWLAKSGSKVCLIEGDSLGGTCLNYGCIPTKALYHYAKLIHSIEKHQTLGIQTGKPSLDMSSIMKQKTETVDSLVSGVETLLKKSNVTIIKGHGHFLDDHRVLVELLDKEDDIVVHGDYIVIATGSETIIPKIPGLLESLDSGFLITSKEALTINNVPKSLVIIGGGVIGMEFATIYNQFGCDVTVIEALETILPSFDKELVKRYKPIAKKQGIKIVTKAKVVEVNHTSGEVLYETAKGNLSISCDKVLCSVGRKPNYKSLHLENLSLQIHDERKILVDGYMASPIAHIYGIGDVNGISLLAHSASKQGVIAGSKIIEQLINNKVEHILDMKVKSQTLKWSVFNYPTQEFSHYAIPQVAFLIPEMAQVKSNLGEDDHLRHGKFAYRSNGMALASIEKDGICKVTYSEKFNQLDYMGILGDSSPEMIHIGSHGMDHKNDFLDFVDTIVGHPSYSEILHESLLKLYDLGVHQL